jgi:hypothetical protein
VNLYAYSMLGHVDQSLGRMGGTSPGIGVDLQTQGMRVVASSVDVERVTRPVSFVRGCSPLEADQRELGRAMCCALKAISPAISWS